MGQSVLRGVFRWGNLSVGAFFEMGQSVRRGNLSAGAFCPSTQILRVGHDMIQKIGYHDIISLFRDRDMELFTFFYVIYDLDMI